jgi:hypothetical protein
MKNSAKKKQHTYPFKWTMELCCCCSQPIQDLRFMKSNGDLKEPLNFDSKNLKKLMHHWFWNLEIWWKWTKESLKAWKGWLIVGQLAHNVRATPKVITTIRPWQWASTMTHLWCRFYNWNMMHLTFKVWTTLLQLWVTTIEYILVLWYTQCMLQICHIASLQQCLHLWTWCILILQSTQHRLLSCVVATMPIVHEFWKENYALAMIHEHVATYIMHMQKW